MTTTEVDNWPADAEGVMGPDLMARFRKHAERFNTEMIFDTIHTAKLTEKPITLIGDSGTYTRDALIITTGASAHISPPSNRNLRPRRRLRHRDGFFLSAISRSVSLAAAILPLKRRYIPGQYRQPCHIDSPSRNLPRGKDHDRQAATKKVAAGKITLATNYTLDEVLGDKR